jgi:hypothetical protein
LRRDIVSEVTEATEGEQLAMMAHRDGCSRKGMGCDGILQDAKGGCEVLVLIVESSDRSEIGQVQIQKNGPRLRL